MKVDREINDGIYRATLLEWLYQSSYKDNKRLKDFIIHEASYEDVVLAVMDNKPFFKEDGDTKTSRSLKIQQAEEKSGMFMDILGFLFGGFITDKAAKKFGVDGATLAGKGLLKNSAAKGGIGAGRGFVKNAGKRAGAKSMLTRGAAATARVGVGWIIVPGILVWLAKKAIFGTLKKVNKQCVQSCESKIKKSPQRNILVKVCISQCKIADYQRGMNRINGQLGQCGSADVKNPEKCKAGIMKTLGQFREMIVKEQEKLQKLKNKNATNTQPKTTNQPQTSSTRGNTL